MSDNPNYDSRLKPCPFCGGKAYLGFYVDGVDNYVYCSECPVGSDNFDGEQAAIDAWNRRTEIAERDRRIAELEAQVFALVHNLRSIRAMNDIALVHSYVLTILGDKEAGR